MSEQKTRTTRRLLLTGVPVIAIAAASYLHLSGGRYVTTENAYVKANIIRISTKINGTVAEVRAKDNSHVQSGDVLFRLDDAQLKLALDSAIAEVDAVRQDMAALRARYSQELLELKRAQERTKFFETRYKRQKRLKTGGFASQAKLEDAAHQTTIARQEASALRGRSRITITELGGRLDAPISTHAKFRKAMSKRNVAALNLKRATIHAPVSGTLSNVTLQPGEQVAAGRPLFALVDKTDYWLQANLKEVHLTNVRVGQTATVILDAYPNYEWQASVESISPATGAEFSVLPAQNASGNWVKVVQRVPVRIKLDMSETSPPLRVGMTAHVVIDTGAENGPGAVAKASTTTQP